MMTCTRILLILCLATGFSFAQLQTTRVPRSTGITPVGPYAGSVSSGEKITGVLPLTMEDAIDRGLRFNLALTEGGEEVRARRAERLRALSALLPTLSLRPSIAEQQVNLAAFGFSGFPGVPSVVGPFTLYDARAYGTESLSFQNWRTWKASRESIRSAELSNRDAREQVVLLVTAAYLQAAAGLARIEAQRGQVTTAETEAKQAQDRKNAGTVPGIDVLRAQVELQAEQQRLISYEGEFDKQKLTLARMIGLAPGQGFDLADRLHTTTISPEVPLEESIQRALAGRYDLQAAQASVRAAEMEKSAQSARRLPSVGVDANYGANGLSPTTLRGGFTVAAGVNIPIFQGGRVRAEMEAADAVLRQRRAELDDLRSGVEADIRSAYTDLRSATRQVEVAATGLNLAKQQLQQAQDRFAAGVTNNLEVVQSQQAVAQANENYIASLYLYYGARAAVVRARGDAEQTIRSLLRSQK